MAQPKVTHSSTIYEFCKRHHISVTTGYREISAGRLKIFKIGRLTRVTPEAEQKWLKARKRPFGAEAGA